jgi:DNA-binding NarL/FixJ family response regulator
LENQTAQKPKRKKKSKIQRVYEMRKEGMDVKQISEKMKLSERVIRSYIWRMKNPEAYKALLHRYFEKRRQKKETEAIKAAGKNQNSK